MKSKKKAAALCIPGARWPEGQGPGAKICPWTPRGITRQTPDWLLMGGSNILSFWTGAPLMQEINQIYDQLRSFGPIFHEIPDMIFVHFCKCPLRFWQLLENTNYIKLRENSDCRRKSIKIDRQTRWILQKHTTIRVWATSQSERDRMTVQTFATSADFQ